MPYQENDANRQAKLLEGLTRLRPRLETVEDTTAASITLKTVTSLNKLSTTKTPQTVTLQVTILCQQISKKKQHAAEHSFALTLRRSFVKIFWQKNLTKLQLAVLPFAVF